MATKMNLLPAEYTVSKGVSLLMKFLRSAGVISVVAFFVFTIGLSAFYLISSATLKNINSGVETLKTQIIASQKIEQQSVLIKDRLTKIKTILALPNINRSLAAVRPYTTQTSGTSNLGELNIDARSVDFSLNFRTVSDLTNFLNSISNETNFDSVTMTSFVFSPSQGYTVGIKATIK